MCDLADIPSAKRCEDAWQGRWRFLPNRTIISSVCDPSPSRALNMQLILFIVFSIVALGAALVVVILRDVFQSSLFLLISCLGVAGLFALLGAPVIAALQVLIFVGGIAALIRIRPAPVKEMARSNGGGLNRRWWVAAPVTAALCGTLVWAALGYRDADTVPVPAGSVAALGTTLTDPAGFLLPLLIAFALLLIAFAGAARIVRGR
jgi:NADH:ubiquinone oxidoreductase subunit 6 (subunit J)